MNPQAGFDKPSFLFRIAALGIFSFLIAEITFRILDFPSVAFRLNDKILHCLKPGLFSDSVPWIRLCPNANLKLYHPQKRIEYEIHTDSKGERISREVLLNSSTKEVWLVGDSVAMGYLVSDSDTVSWQMQSSNKNLRFRNLGVDAVGSLGIRERLAEAISENPPPLAAYWLYHISDLTDSFREEALIASFSKRILVRVSFYLSRYSAVFNAGKLLYEKWKPETAENLVLPSEKTILDKDHPHRRALVELFRFVRENKIPLVLVLLPEPTVQYEPLVDSELVKEVRQIASEQSIRVLDLQNGIRDFWQEGKNPVFIPMDGHPNAGLYSFIASELTEDLNRAQNWK